MTKNVCRLKIGAFAIIFILIFVAEVNGKPPNRHLGHTLATAARLMADNQTGSVNERENNVLKAANKIMEELEAENEVNREKASAAYDYNKKRYEKVRSELPNRIHRMYYRRGLLNKAARCLEGVVTLVKGEIRHKIKMVLKPLPIGGKCKEAISRFGSEFIVEGHRSVKNFRVLKRSLHETDKVVKAEVDFFKDLSKKLQHMPKRETAEKVKQLNEKCLEACLKIKAECTRKNCKDKGYSGVCRKLWNMRKPYLWICLQ